jgi:hypothetical protein
MTPSAWEFRRPLVEEGKSSTIGGKNEVKFDRKQMPSDSPHSSGSGVLYAELMTIKTIIACVPPDVSLQCNVFLAAFTA